MDIQLNTDFCTNSCKSIEKCSKYCALHAGRALENFINNVDMVESRIGEYDRRERGGKLDLVVSGHQLWDLKSASWLLTDISTTLDAAQKFRSICGKTPLQVLEMYCKHSGMSEEDTKETISKLQKINKNKLLIIPFKPHAVCNADIEVDKVKDKNRQGEIAYIKWHTCRETFKLLCTIGIGIDGATNKSVYRYNITDYLDKFRLSNLDMKAKGNKGDKTLIQVTNHGIIKPIAVNEGNVTIAIDSTYLYLTFNGETSIIGYWDANEELIITKQVQYKALKKITDNLGTIKMHRKYIAPYLMYEANEVTVRNTSK